jgi:hypothetical protein
MRPTSGVAGGFASRRDGVCDAGGDEGLPLGDLRCRPMAEDEEPGGRVGAAPSEVVGVLIGVAARHNRTHASGEGVEDPGAGLAQPEPIEHLAGRGAVEVPVEEHRPVAESAPGAGIATGDVAVD